MTLFYIITACLIGSTLSAVLASLLAWRVQPQLIPVFVSYAVGALLGVVFLDLLPHVFSDPSASPHAGAWLLAGIVAFFVLEKLVLWRHGHEHTETAEADEHVACPGHNVPALGHLSTGWTVIVGDAFHNFTDGLAIAAAFTTDFRLGVVTSVAIIAHELPHELGDFLVLVHSGFSRRRALAWNVVSSLATLAGALLAWFALRDVEAWSSVLLCFAAASMIYVAIADLIPSLQRRLQLRESVLQIVLIGAGVGTIAATHSLLH